LTTIAFCLLTYREDHPSGIERSIAALAEGLRRAGHEAFILAGGPPSPGDGPDVARLASVTLPRPAVNADVLAALADPAPVTAEARRILASRGAEIVCWGAPVWGLGHLHPAPPGAVTALMAHNTIRPASAATWAEAIAAADVVLPASPYLLDAAREGGWDTSKWTVLPNALLTTADPPGYEQRERLRRHGPLRLLSRAVPVKGQAAFLAAMPGWWDRPVEFVLAEADFEFERGETARALADCQAQRDRRPDVVRILPALPWRQAPAFLGGAALTPLTTLEPETFSFVAAESLSAGTPVAAFGLGYVPDLVGPAGAIVAFDDGMPALWDAVARLLAGHDSYHAAARAAPGRLAGHQPEDAAAAFLSAIAPYRPHLTARQGPA
jgi:glycosyltransferase involved in cell wall biosynthesis